MVLKYFVVIVCSFGVLACGSDKKTSAYNEAKEVAVESADTDLPELYEKLIHSESFIEMNKLMNNFIGKLNIKVPDSDILKDEIMFENWLKSNIAQTKFKSIDEALESFRQLRKANALCVKENADYYKAYANATSDADIMQYSPIPEY